MRFGAIAIGSAAWLLACGGTDDTDASSADLTEATIAPTSDGQVFGIDDGRFEGGGVLESQDWVPNADYHSTRTLRAGTIEARTVASKFGFTVAEAGARLQVVPTTPGHFDLLDLDASSAKAGEGSCTSSCTFTATVMGGTLTLTETWTRSASGFELTQGSQTFKGHPAIYAGTFTRKP